MAKGRPKDKHVTMTQAKARKMANDLYWQILRMFLAAAMDVYGWKEDDVVKFAARVNWYFDAAKKERTITEDLVDQLIEENMGLIMRETDELKERTE